MASSSSPSDEVYVHRLVQDENAKTILLNVPIETAVELIGTKGNKQPRTPTASGYDAPPAHGPVRGDRARGTS